MKLTGIYISRPFFRITPTHNITYAFCIVLRYEFTVHFCREAGLCTTIDSFHSMYISNHVVSQRNFCCPSGLIKQMQTIQAYFSSVVGLLEYCIKETIQQTLVAFTIPKLSF